jgi:hypothetical protein
VVGTRVGNVVALPAVTGLNVVVLLIELVVLLTAVDKSVQLVEVLVVVAVDK